MSRVNPLSDKSLLEIRRMIVLRHRIGLGQTAFSNIACITVANLIHRERGVVPWQPGEISAITCKLERHFHACLAVVEEFKDGAQ